MKNIADKLNGYTNGIGGGTTPTELTDEPIENIKSDWEMIEKIAKEIAKHNTIIRETEEVKVVVDTKNIQ